MRQSHAQFKKIIVQNKNKQLWIGGEKNTFNCVSVVSKMTKSIITKSWSKTFKPYDAFDLKKKEKKKKHPYVNSLSGPAGYKLSPIIHLPPPPFSGWDTYSKASLDSRDMSSLVCVQRFRALCWQSQIIGIYNNNIIIIITHIFSFKLFSALLKKMHLNSSKSRQKKCLINKFSD